MTGNQLATALILLVLTMVSAVGAGADDQGLLAKIYPGAIEDTNCGDATVRVFLSRDAPDQVQTWYEKQQGHLSADAGTELANADNAFSRDIAPIGAIGRGIDMVFQGQVLLNSTKVAWRLKDITEAKAAGVLLQSLERGGSPEEPDRLDPQYPGNPPDETLRSVRKLQRQVAATRKQMLESLSAKDRAINDMSSLFDGFRQEIYHRRHRQQELIAVYAKTSWLESAYYPTMKKSQGTLVSYDAWLMARYKNMLGKEMGAMSVPVNVNHQDLQTLGQRLQKAATAGRMEEVQALQRQMSSSLQREENIGRSVEKISQKDHWGDWLAYLKDLEAHAYRTRIWINTAPQAWGL